MIIEFNKKYRNKLPKIHCIVSIEFITRSNVFKKIFYQTLWIIETFVEDNVFDIINDSIKDRLRK